MIDFLRVFSFECYARDEPDKSVPRLLSEGEREVVETVVRALRPQHPDQRDLLFRSDVRNWLILLVRMAV